MKRHLSPQLPHTTDLPSGSERPLKVRLSSLTSDRCSVCWQELMRHLSLGKITNPRFNPTLRIKGRLVVLHPLEIVSVANENLGELVDSLKEDGDTIIAALDELLTRWHS
jgi:CcdB protein